MSYKLTPEQLDKCTNAELSILEHCYGYGRPVETFVQRVCLGLAQEIAEPLTLEIAGRDFLIEWLREHVKELEDRTKSSTQLLFDSGVFAGNLSKENAELREKVKQLEEAMSFGRAQAWREKEFPYLCQENAVLRASATSPEARAVLDCVARSASYGVDWMEVQRAYRDSLKKPEPPKALRQGREEETTLPVAGYQEWLEAQTARVHHFIGDTEGGK